jgi:hypothetical protein
LQVLRQIVTSNDSFGGWGPNVLAWQQRKSPTATIRYEDLVADPATVIETAMAALCKRPPIRCGASMPSFDELHGLMPLFFRRGRIGGWRDEMPGTIQELFWERHRQAMVRLGYE